MKITSTNKKLRELLTGIRKGELIPNPDFQRRLVWTNKHKVALIKTVLDGYPFPEIYIAAGHIDSNTGEASESLVDGQQRITTLYQYFIGSSEIQIKNDVSPFKKLDKAQKENFLQYDVVVRDLGSASKKEILEVFTRINSTGYSLNAMEIHNARYDGALKRYAQGISENDFFEKHRVFTATDIRRMNDLRFMLWVIITVISTYFNRDDEIETYLKQYNDDFPTWKRVDKQLKSIFSFIEACKLDEKSRCWKKTDLFTLIIELHRAIYKKKLKLNPKLAGKSLAEFYDNVDLVDKHQPSQGDLYEYSMAALQASNDRCNRVRRGEILERVIKKAANSQSRRVGK